jgi:PRC-barrel domain
MAETCAELTEWIGRDLFDATNARIGVIVDVAFARRKFGTCWLLLDTGAARKFVVPAECISSANDRLTLPYPKGYVETGPAIGPNQPLPKEDERAFHYGFSNRMPGSECRTGCGLCMLKARDRHH